MPHAHYMTNAISNRKQTINKAVRRLRHLRKQGLRFDAIAFTGLSGTLIAPSIADRLGVGLVAVRKTAYNKTHSIWNIETTDDISSYIIVDDLVYTGKTIKKLIKKIRDAPFWYDVEHLVCNGLYLYAHRGSMYGHKEAEKLCGITILNGRLP